VKSASRRRDRDVGDVGVAVGRQVEVEVKDHHRTIVDGDPAQAAVELTAVDDRARVPVRYVKLAIAVGTVAVVAVVGISLLPAGREVTASDPAVSPSRPPSPARSPSSSPAAATDPGPLSMAIEPGRYSIPWPQMRIHLTMPAGWSSANNGTGITRHPLDGPGPTLTLTVHAVTRVRTDVCSATRPLVEVGPTVEDLTTALANQVGIERSGPTDVVLGGHPAKKFALAPDGSCPRPEGHLVWAARVLQPGFSLLDGGTATIYVVDVNGDRLVIASQDRGSSAEDVAQLDAIIASIEIEPSSESTTLSVLPAGPLGIGRHSLTVEGVPLSFSVTTSGWERKGRLYVSKSTVGPQDAEAIIYWTSISDGVYADPCGQWWGSPVGSMADFAAHASRTPGTELVTGPSDVTVGGRAAEHVVLTVREDVGCDPGFLYTWHDQKGGAFWTSTDVGDTIRVWIVDVDGTRLFIAGETHKDAGPTLEDEVQQIVDSIQFE
jgi:hypothetical protein